MDYDYFIIGSGFGGSVAARRLTEKGYTTGLAEMGRRFAPGRHPKTNFGLRRFLWMPGLGMRGIFRMTLMPHVFILSGAGYGGGSLTYANTLLVPPEHVWDDADWARLENWKTVMPAYYDRASTALGANQSPRIFDADNALRRLAEGAGRASTYYHQQVGVLFGENEEAQVGDPYFNGAGPNRTTCNYCGSCMIGCNVGAKNTLDRNYLALAEGQGLDAFTDTMVLDVQPLGAADGSEGYRILLKPRGRRRRWVTSRGVVFSGGTLGTMNLLLRLKDSGSLPRLSDQVGATVRTNAESIVGIKSGDRTKDMSKGIAIGSGFYLTDDIHVQAVRYNKGSDLIGFLATPLPSGQPGWGRIFRWLGYCLRHPLRALGSLAPFGFAKSTLILLVMRTVDSALRFRLRRSFLRPWKKVMTSAGKKVPAYIPELDRMLDGERAKSGQTVKSTFTELLFDIPTTAHILGGAAMGASPDDGVVDSRHRVFGYENMLVCDGSVIGANLGVNPALTITALAERAMDFVPEKKDS